MVDFMKEAKAIESEIVAWRRDFHKHPELSFEEVRTAGIISEHLTKLGIEHRTGLGKTGIVGYLHGKEDGPVIMLRFDIDALPIPQESDLDYASVYPGKMHGCGHDGHAAMGMGVASILSENKDSFNGTIMLVFQPAEEVASGAQAMVDDGALDPMPEMAFGIHVHSRTKKGVVKLEPGPVLAAADMFEFTVYGKGGHGAEPHDTVDPIVITSQIINNIQMIVSRNVNPLDVAVVSIGSIHAGDAPNVIADSCHVRGNIRTYLPETREMVHERIQQIVESTAKANGATSEFKLIYGVPATVNNPEITEEIFPILEKLIGVDNISKDARATPSEDMSIFLQKAPGAYLVLGAGGDDFPPHHNPKFHWDDSLLSTGVAIMCEIAAHFSTK